MHRGAGPHTGNVFVSISSFGFHRRHALMLTVASEGNQWGPVKLMCMFVCLSVSQAVSLSLYLVICVAFWQSFA